MTPRATGYTWSIPSEEVPGMIARLRDVLSVSQQEFARLVDVDRVTVARWETGTRRPDAAFLADLVVRVAKGWYAGFRRQGRGLPRKSAGSLRQVIGSEQ